MKTMNGLKKDLRQLKKRSAQQGKFIDELKFIIRNQTVLIDSLRQLSEIKTT